MNCVGLGSNDLLARGLGLHDRLLKIDLLLKQVLYLFDVVNVVFVDVEVPCVFLRRSFLLDLLEQLTLICHPLRLFSLLQHLLGLPVLLVRPHVIPHLRMLLTLLDLADVLSLRNLLHEVVLERGIRLVLRDLSLHMVA